MKKLIIFCLSFLVLFGACALDASSNTYRGTLTSQEITPLNEDFVYGINAYGIDTAQRLYTEDENLAISPVSIELAVLMTRVGAAEQTADELASAMQMSGITDEDIINACQSLMWRANTGGMQAANSIWLGSRYEYSDSFVTTCTEEFMADAMPLEIPGAKDDINLWVNEKTNGKIDSIYNEELSADTEAVLVNALYYLGEWALPFEAHATTEKEFYTPSKTVTASFMRDSWNLPYYANDDFSMVSLSFKSEEDEGEYAMAFLLPSEDKTVSDLLATLDADTFANALSGMEDKEVIINLPKFDFDFSTSLVDTLKEQGVSTAFKYPGADFSAMTDGDNELYISEVLHKCYIRIDELGAEAAAVTVVEQAAGEAMEIEPPKEFIADHPFVFAIYSSEDGAIAFLGAVNDPTV